MATTRDNAIMLALYRTASRDKDFKWVVKYSKSETAFLRMGDPINSLDQARRLDSIGMMHKSFMDDLLKAAGSRVYAAKNVGRNSIRVAENVI
ncbi:MAG: hypothetical protein GY744_15345 [Gammaproteobacteria bacterium]|nr:hypothetical protein [Gammaproteobacteria bacterium]